MGAPKGTEGDCCVKVSLLDAEQLSRKDEDRVGISHVSRSWLGPKTMILTYMEMITSSVF